MTKLEPATGVLFAPQRLGRAVNAPAIDIAELSLATQRTVGRWELVQLAGRGSWSQVFRARPIELPEDRPASYAVKLVCPERQEDPLAGLLLAREAVLGRRVSSPHVVPVLEAQLQRGPKFIVMPWLEGANLEEWIEDGRDFDLPVVIWIARQAAEGLAALDKAGYSHGDIKPSNIFLDARGHVTLLDLAFARRHDEPCERRDRTIAGTGYYLAPEHFRPIAQSAADIRGDIYSLGVVLYQLLSGTLPITGRTLDDVARAHKQGAVKPLRSLVPNLTPGVAALVQSMLAKDPLRRPQSPRELIAALVRLEIQTFGERAA